jgi:hypothetical protein
MTKSAIAVPSFEDGHVRTVKMEGSCDSDCAPSFRRHRECMEVHMREK